MNRRVFGFAVGATLAMAAPHEMRDELLSHQKRRWYRCYDGSGEGYGAAWLAHRSTVLRHKMRPRVGTNMETGGWIPGDIATPLQSVDLFDCSVEHLSWLERRIGLRDAKGKAKRVLDAELIGRLRDRAAVLERRSADATTSPHRLATVAVLPFFATSPDCDTDAASCGTGSSAPAMRRHFLNATFWSIRAALTPHVVLSTCSAADAAFGRSCGLPFFDVLLSDCRIASEGRGTFFKPSLLGAHTVTRVRERLADRDSPWHAFRFVYYSEADQVLHVRDGRRVLAVVDETHYVSPHRVQPLAHPRDLPSLAGAEGRSWLPRWSRDDLDRAAAIGRLDPANVTAVPRGARDHRCCLGRAECNGDGRAGDRRTWSPWKVATPNLDLVSLDDSLVSVAAHQGNYGALLFRGCRVEHVPNAGLRGCPP